jgi:hypothetical protein
MAVTAWGQLYIQPTMPAEDPVQVGSVWVDTSSTAVVKVCTSVSPYTFSAGSSGAVEWGDIGGTLANQTDLQTALDAKVVTTRQVISGAGLTGGGDLSADRTLAVGAGAGITVAADAISVDQSVLKLDDFAAPDNNTDLDATISAHGLQPKFPNTDTVETGRGTFITLSALLDYIGSAAQGDVLYRDAASWARLPAGTSGHVLKTNGAGANPEWVAQSGAPSSGNWTPVVAGEGGTSGQSYTTQVGRYIKIGPLVIAFFHILFSAKGTITGSVEITGLPFSIVASPANHGTVFVGYNAAAGTPQLMFGVPIGGTSTVDLYLMAGTDATPDRLVTGNLGNTTALYGTVIYETGA